MNNEELDVMYNRIRNTVISDGSDIRDSEINELINQAKEANRLKEQLKKAEGIVEYAEIITRNVSRLFSSAIDLDKEMIVSQLRIESNICTVRIKMYQEAKGGE